MSDYARAYAALVALIVVIFTAPVMFIIAIANGPGQQANASTVGGAFPAGVNVGLNPAELLEAARALGVSDRLHTEPLPELAMVVSALGESHFNAIPNGKGSGYCGVFQADPANIPCTATEEQAESFLKGGRGFHTGAIALARDHPGMTPGAIATFVEVSGQPASFYDIGPDPKHPFRDQAELIIDAWHQGSGLTVPGQIAGSPKHIIDTVVLPLSNASGVPRTVAENDAANGRHGPTDSGGVSDHQGPPDVRWAADMSNGHAPTPQMDRLATALAELFGLAPLDLTTSGARGSRQDSSRTFTAAGGERYRVQMIYRSYLGGNHDNHVHFGVALIAGPFQ